MKKLILSAALMAGLGFAAKAENLEVYVDEDLCIPGMTLVYEDESESDHDLGCTGSYQLAGNDQAVAYILVEGVACYPGGAAEVVVAGKVVKVSYKNGKVTFGGGTTHTDKP